MAGAPAADIHRRAWEKSQAGKPLNMLETVALRAIDPEATQATGHIVTVDAYHGGANAQYKKVGKAVGSVLKVAAPVAGLAIPGLGSAAAAALAAGGSAAGGALAGDQFNLGKTALAGAAGYGGAALRGTAGAAGASTASGTGTPFDPSGMQALFGGGSVTRGGLGGILSQAGNYVLQHPGQVARVGLGALGAIQGSHQQGKADELINRSLAPLNQANPYADLNVGSFGNPYAQPAQMSGRQSLRRELMR